MLALAATAALHMDGAARAQIIAEPDARPASARVPHLVALAALAALAATAPELSPLMEAVVEARDTLARAPSAALATAGAVILLLTARRGARRHSANARKVNVRINKIRWYMLTSLMH
jgi:hypothetical protein